MGVYDEFLDGAIDLHCHIDLEFSEQVFRKREPEWEWLPKAARLGVRGVVLKSHWWPTTAAVAYLRALGEHAMDLYASITLNPVAGGPELWAVEAAAAMGARVVFLPTWGAQNDLAHEGFHARLPSVYRTFDPGRIQGACFIDATGRLTTAARELLRYCQERDLTLATGHIAWQESLAFAEEARAIRYERLIFTHPLAGFIKAPLEATRRAAELGAWVELCWTNVAPGRLDPAAAVRWIREVGLDHVVVSTDYFRAATPNPPELFRFLLGTLYEAGLSAEEIRRVSAINPALALGLPPR